MNELIKRLHRYSENCVAYKLDADFADAVQQATNYIEELSDKDTNVLRWVPVNERLPARGTNVLVVEFGKVELAYTTTYTSSGSLCWVVINGGCYHRVNDKECPIKWWMPLPELPKEG